MSALTLCFLLLVTGEVAYLQLQNENERSNIGSCSKLTRLNFGTSDDFSADGIVAQVLNEESAEGEVEVRITGFNIVCEAAGARRDTISSISVIIAYQYMDSVSAPINRTEQFQLDCAANLGDDSSFMPPRIVLEGGLRTENPSGTLDTPLNEKCGRCIDSILIPTAESDTHCSPCPSECVGQQKCRGVSPEWCCNWYLNDVCVVDCPEPLIGDNKTFNCGCGALNVANAIIDFSDGHSVESVATQTCDSDNGYIHSITDMTNATRTCTMQGWSGLEITCEKFDCGALSPPSFGQVSSESTLHGSVATFSCDPDHLMIGNTTRTCTMDGWSGTSPICVNRGSPVVDPLSPDVTTASPVVNPANSGAINSAATRLHASPLVFVMSCLAVTSKLFHD